MYSIFNAVQRWPLNERVPVIHSLTAKNIQLDRKMLSELAVSDSPTFKKVVETAVN